ncbi:MAG: hypothetical protein COS39_06195 [Hydrogenophilales bacterium CG03_land_8_20_14_0_80_62_28]|nr:hypothetical protein [Betaproteobacteria bacterium]OIO78503.1 MAG: hypothetical protein AUJ86_05740 [Hydrogenophilaceae bacterium CG1_02_62_390]PIV22846.1 MAG: hypothetical protein COS39_06195 [Hydrogenophilales bacterium CG03_land_8_20_14_0_80_62_28]PIW37895.1 MAG: hypothetical protein COW23_08850 [Hydrogenophilales bacterium CG15_BIG_FIL_POST_REV_8_21_14_020_62_31]PIW71471.1 MAG: hypothetical protein COW07_07960 [Hydrogenophilales bacterium CG12_big_fil_rev_8_21_14_0_65_61_21]PIX01976.1 M
MHILKKLLPILLVSALLSSLPAGATEQDKESLALVEKIVLAYGGAEAIEKVTAVNAEGEIKAPVRGDHGTYKRWFKRPRLLRVETAYQRGAETRILNGDQVWRSGGGSALKSISGPGAMAVIYQYKQLDLPYGLLKGVYNLRYAGKETLDGVATDALEVSDAEGPAMRVNVDVVSHYIVRISGRIEFGGAATELAAMFSDYRPMAGTVMPFRIHNFAGGMAVSETVIQHYSVNPAGDPALFDPPIKDHHGRVLSLASPLGLRL